MAICVSPELRPETEVPMCGSGNLFLTHKKTVVVIGIYLSKYK